MYLFFVLDDDNGLLCYIHNISPLKKGAITGQPYFNFMLQQEAQSRRGVCFTPAKRNLMQNLLTAKSPVKTSNFTDKSPDIILNQNSRIQVVDVTEAKFQHDRKFAAGAIVSIADISKPT